MARIIELQEIKQILASFDPLPLIEQGFVAYSEGKAVVPPVGELLFDHPPGDVHIKYGYLYGDDYYVIKVASGFYENAARGLPPNSGLMLLFNQKTGSLESILLDEGYLTNVRTAVAGAIAAKYLKPSHVEAIGVFGTGIQARMQVQFLQTLIPCRQIVVCGRTLAHLYQYQDEFEAIGYDVQTTTNPSEVLAACNLIVTATPAKQPLFAANEIRTGTHVTAMGSDTPEKNELPPALLARADVLVVDSLSQCQERGELHHALTEEKVDKQRIAELGKVIADPGSGRTSDQQVTIADLTGVAVQDIQIAKAVFAAVNQL